MQCGPPEAKGRCLHPGPLCKVPCQQGDVNVCQPLLYSERPMGDGWSDTSVKRPNEKHSEYNDINTARNFRCSLMHGPWGNDKKSVERKFELPAGSEKCTVKWISYGLRTRDNKHDRVFSYYSNDGSSWQGRKELWVSRMSQGSIHDKTITNVDCSQKFLRLEFTSEIDQAFRDEGWGFSDVQVKKGDKLVYNERLEGKGWSDQKVENSWDRRDQCKQTRMHGTWGNEKKEVKRTFPLGSSTSSCKIKWTSYGLRTRDGKHDKLYVDGKEVWSEAVRQNYKDVEKTVPCSGEVELKFTSGIDSDRNDEQWGFGNLQIWQS
mmetsp:Transcript_56215/g.100169  ORF Transcript_56215/g.100169 Transcript_56215/m.100169 type:complete len:320 (+) Transcript_56215:293-1252(+)